jgi:hypothetical protein
MSVGHQCENAELYVMQDVTVWLRLAKNGRIGGIRQSKAHITQEAQQSVGDGDADVVCAGCGWMGRLSAVLAKDDGQAGKRVRP